MENLYEIKYLCTAISSYKLSVLPLSNFFLPAGNLNLNHCLSYGCVSYNYHSKEKTGKNRKFHILIGNDGPGYDLYDFQARQYDPQLGRFWGIDPANQYPSGYIGMGNDPANLVDPTGMAAGSKNYANNGYNGSAGVMAGAQTHPGDLPQQDGGSDYSDPYAWETMEEANQEAASSSGSSQAADAADPCADPSAADPTDVVTDDGQHVTTIPDGTNNVFVINPGSVGLFWSRLAGSLLSGSVDLASAAYFGDVGVDYDVPAFRDWGNEYLTKSLSTHYNLSDGTSISFNGASNYKFNNVSTQPYAEYLTGNTVKDNLVMPGHGTSRTDLSLTQVDPHGSILNTHTHFNSKDGGFTYDKSGGGLDNGAILFLHEGPSPGDRNGAFEGNYRNVIVTPNTIILYNRTSTITLHQ